MLQPFCHRLCRKRVGHFAAKMQKKIFFLRKLLFITKTCEKDQKVMLAHEEMRVHASAKPKNELVERHLIRTGGGAGVINVGYKPPVLLNDELEKIHGEWVNIG